MMKTIRQPGIIDPATGALGGRFDPPGPQRPWRLLVPLAVALAALASPTAGHAQRAARGAGCHLKCWARAAFFGDVLNTADPEAAFTQVVADFELESKAAFLIDATTSLMVSANLHGYMSAFKAEWRGPTVDCKPAYYAFTIPDRLRVISYLGIAPGRGSSRGQLAVTVGPTYPQPPQAVHEHQHQDAFTCGGQEHPAFDSDTTHPNDEVDYPWPFRGPLGTMDYPWFLQPGITLRPGQPATLRTLTFQYREARYHHRYMATVHLFIELCPDQDLAHNCAIPEMPDLPG